MKIGDYVQGTLRISSDRTVLEIGTICRIIDSRAFNFPYIVKALNGEEYGFKKSELKKISDAEMMLHKLENA
jgi:hypothetical protein